MRIIVFIIFIIAQTAIAQPSLIDPLEKSGVPKSITINNTDISHMPVAAEGKKSVPLAILYSLLLPGMGELYAGNYNTGKYLTAAEGGLWITLVGLDRYGIWLRDDARTFAAEHAGINPAGKNNQYFVDIGNYNTIYDYNQKVLRDRNPYKLYNENSNFAWTWDSRSNREYFRNVRIKSDNMFNSVNFVAAAIAINHIISAVNAARVAISYNKSADHASSFEIYAGVMGGIGNPHGIMISVSKAF
jgi:TM2 domain-containing membrane protein YozV